MLGVHIKSAEKVLVEKAFLEQIYNLIPKSEHNVRMQLEELVDRTETHSVDCSCCSGTLETPEILCEDCARAEFDKVAEV